MSDENQHWVPKLLVKKFTDSDGRVFRLDIHSDKVTKLPPRKAAAGPGFNDFEVEGQVISFEDRLEKIETKAAHALKRIIETRSLKGLSPKDRKRIADFVAAQSFRTEAFYKGLGNSPLRNDFGPPFSRLWESLFLLSAQIEGRHWALMVTDGEDIFYLGDHPVVLQRTKDPKDGSNLGFDVEGVEVFIPLSPQTALYMPCRTTSEEIIARYNAAVALHRAVRTVVFRGMPGGTAELAIAQDTIRKSDELFRAFTTGRAIRAQQSHIENLNYLQCSWAHSAIYSNRRDFTFARRVFRENPQYRTVPKTRIVTMTVLVPDTKATKAS